MITCAVAVNVVARKRDGHAWRVAPRNELPWVILGGLTLQLGQPVGSSNC
jgi:hypothetical protein